MLYMIDNHQEDSELVVFSKPVDSLVYVVRVESMVPNAEIESTCSSADHVIGLDIGECVRATRELLQQIVARLFSID